MKRSNLKEIRSKKEYKKSEDFRTYYVTGALGGFNNPYDFRLAFYNIDRLSHIISNQEIERNSFDSEKEFFEEIAKKKMPHKILCEIVMTKKAVEELHRFLGDQLELIEKMYQIDQESGQN